jgi:signal transduction histidine kinase
VTPAPPPPASTATTQVTIADEGARLRRWTRAVFASVWLVPGVLAGVVAWTSARGDGVTLSLGRALLWQLACWLPWALWSQGVLTLIDRVPLDARRLGGWLATHLLACAVTVTASVLLVAWLDAQFAPWAIGLDGFPEVLRRSAPRHVAFGVMLYWTLLGAAYMVEYVRRYRERDRAATALEEQLSRQQLEALRTQLNPHFLFNALNSVTELMEEDVRRAQRALIAVSDLLRLSLKSAGRSTIPLWQEIELVELYLQLARVRYGDGLVIDINVDPAAVDIEVPSFVLQPLIENALKHGLSPGRTGQAVLVQARRAGSMLELLVSDNGRGLNGRVTDSGSFLAAQPSVDGLGIGLTNTRTRLSMLYGDRYAFRMSNAGNGGCLVEIRIPTQL